MPAHVIHAEKASSAPRNSGNHAGLPLRVRIVDVSLAEELIAHRKKLGIDLYDEVWDGVYVMPSLPSLPHQRLVLGLGIILAEVVLKEGLGEVYPGANVSDRRDDWKSNFRVPDVVVVLKDSKAVDCDTFLYGGPDFLVEIQTPGDATEEKIAFYGKIQVRELLILHRDTLELRLFRHDGRELVQVKPTTFKGKKALVSEVLPLALQQKSVRGKPRLTVWRTTGKAHQWTV